MNVKSTIVVALSFFAVFGHGTQSIAGGDVEAGKKVFAKCKACHKTDPGKHAVGPSLFGVFGRPVASAEGYEKYSAGMKAFGNGKTWDEQLLNDFLTKPRDLVKGTKMAFPGLSKSDQRDDLIAYLKTLK